MVPVRILLVSENRDLYEQTQALCPENYTLEWLPVLTQLHTLTRSESDVLLLDVSGELGNDMTAVGRMRSDIGDLPVIVVVQPRLSVEHLNRLLSLPALAALEYPLQAARFQELLTEAAGLTLLAERQKNAEYQRRLQQNLDYANRRLNQRLQELNTIYTVGKFVASTLDLAEVLGRVVETSVNLTQAEEGFILLRERDKLYLRVSKNMNEEVAQRFHLEANDAVAWQVIRSARPTVLHRDTKIATGYLARSLLYVPLQVAGRGCIGVLALVNQLKDEPFTEHHLFAISSLADFAAVALENARLFAAVETEHSRLSSILAHAAEAVLVTDMENNLLLWSRTAADMFDIRLEMQGRPLREAVQHDGIRDLFEEQWQSSGALHQEIELEDQRVFNAQLSTIEGIGRVAIMQDISHLKELDRLKSEFVSTVSHDLRTPLTTIQGYIELMDRVGSLNDIQRSFIQKALNSLHHITVLITDLLDIGRIEAGYDLDMQACRLDLIIKQTLDEYTLHAEREELTLTCELPDAPLSVLGNANRLRQVMQNLVSNAIKYNRPGGWVKITGSQDEKYVMVEVQDTGIGIPVSEQMRVFDRFYRVQSPGAEMVHGTGLGLAIVKSVIEKHKGRIWVRSTLGQGSVFAFLLPKYL